MRNQRFLALLAAAGLAGCGGDPPAPTAMTQQPKPAIKSANATPVAPQPKSQPAAANTNTNVPAPAKPVVEQTPIPAGARYAIFCERYSAAGHAQQARFAKENLIRQTGRREFHVIHEPQSSILMYGYYAEIDRKNDQVEADRAQKDRKWLEALATPSGQQMFRQCPAMIIPQPNPDAPPEWDLTKLDRDKPLNDPARKYWTIVVAAYTPQFRDQNNRSASHKQLAIDTVKEMRSAGIEAYYYFDDEMSHVCVGAWPRAAIKAQEKADANTRGSGKSNSQEKIQVFTSPMSDEERKRIEADGHTKVFAPKVEVQDASMARIWQEYPEYAVDGYVKTDKQTNQRQESFLAEIPKLAPSLLSGIDPNAPSANSGANAAPPPNLLGPGTAKPDTGGRLRKVNP